MKPPGLAVYTKQDPEAGYPVREHHYENLRDRLDRHETGWIELESVYGDGRTLVRLEDIIALDLWTPSRCEAFEAFRMTDGQ